MAAPLLHFAAHDSHPFNELEGVDQIANRLWLPIKKSFKKIQRRMDIFYAGTNLVDKHTSVINNTKDNKVEPCCKLQLRK